MTVGGMNVREALHIKKVEMLWTFSVRAGGSRIDGLFAPGGQFPLCFLSKNLKMLNFSPPAVAQLLLAFGAGMFFFRLT